MLEKLGCNAQEANGKLWQSNVHTAFPNRTENIWISSKTEYLIHIETMWQKQCFVDINMLDKCYILCFRENNMGRGIFNKFQESWTYYGLPLRKKSKQN